MDKKCILAVFFLQGFLFGSDFMFYVDQNDIISVEKMVQNGQNVNITDKDGYTALHVAAWNGYIDMVRYLLEMGANPNLKSLSGNPPMKFAHSSCREILLQYGALSSDKPSEIIPLYYTQTVYIENPCQQQHTIATHMYKYNESGNLTPPPPSALKKKNIPVVSSFNYPRDSYSKLAKISTEESLTSHAWDTEGKNSLHRACSSGDLTDIKRLVQLGINPLSKNTNGDTALRFAAEYGHLDASKYLVENLGVNVNSRNNEGTTALIVATIKNHISIVQYLLRMGANPNIDTVASVQRKIEGVFTDSAVSKWSPLMAAAQSGNDDLIDILIGASANINATDSDNWTALMYAAQNGHLTTVKKLITLGANYNIESKDKHTALSIAYDNEQTKTVELLESMGARESSVDRVSVNTEEIEVVENVKVEKYEYYTDGEEIVSDNGSSKDYSYDDEEYGYDNYDGASDEKYY